MSATYELKVNCPKCQTKTHTLASTGAFMEVGHTWIEFCPSCGWFYFVARPYGNYKIRMMLDGVDASDEDLEIINKILKTNTDINISLIQKEGNWKNEDSIEH